MDDRRKKLRQDLETTLKIAYEAATKADPVAAYIFIGIRSDVEGDLVLNDCVTEALGKDLICEILEQILHKLKQRD